ncbi:hypothetical protein [Spiroplasma endosymbiont of Nebria brevicollis]|uniref:hypothetical protein n=1 Tax=Spiroplasma endosymbiont of Nebria brevicollis TaxID=3066284 RepID=UPI00313D35D0
MLLEENKRDMSESNLTETTPLLGRNENSSINGDSIIDLEENEWVPVDSRYVEWETLKRVDESGKLEYKTEFNSSNIIIQVINEKFIIIDNKLLWQKVIKLNDGKIILKLINLNDTKQLQETFKVYQNEQAFSSEWLCPTTQSLQENFDWVVIENEINLLNKIINSKYSFSSFTTTLTLSLGSFYLFDAKNNLHEENPLLDLFKNWEDVIISITTGLTMSNLSYLNYKIINLTSKWKYLSFLGVSTVISTWRNYLNLYVSEKDFDLTTFAEAIAFNLVICIFEELIFDKIAQPLIKKIWENLKNKNILKATGFGTIICSLLFLSSLESVISGLFGEQKEVNLENVIKPLPLALLVTLIENSIYSAYFSYFDLFLPRIKNSIVTPLTNGAKWCWNNITSCFTNSDIIENNENVANDSHDWEAENKLLEEFIKNNPTTSVEDELKTIINLVQTNEHQEIPISNNGNYDNSELLLSSGDIFIINESVHNDQSGSHTHSPLIRTV